MKIQTKITLHFLALSTAILLLLNAFILYFEYQFNYKDFFKRLEARVNITADIRLFPDEKTKAYQEVRNRYLEKLDAEKEQLIKSGPDGKFTNPGLPKVFFNDVINNGNAEFKKNNQFYAGKIVKHGDDKYLVVVSAQNPYGLLEIQELQEVLFYGFIGSVIIILFAGKAFSFYIFAPVRKLTDKVNTITSSNLHMRLEHTGKDEIAELSETFNNMLNRLETAFETQNNFVSNASHELRTPLTIINSEVELAINKTKTDSEEHTILTTIQSETNKLTQILNGLLTLAQSGYDGKKQNWQTIRIDELIWEAISSVKKIQPQSDIEVDFADIPSDEQLLNVSGNNNLLNLAITNIISNACKYSEFRLVTVKLSIEDKKVIISIKDLGIGIPATELQHIFVPFFRASNTHEFKGHGVGLPLALNIIRLHKGSIGIRSEVNMGTDIQVFLPAASA
ncbi:HAMP domain-containing sensor histidine kinase [Mucilaginibacter jinjuensis]|uniref:histidine kinase n=1 Tax=Mucilaginibacter jinjuensis TaxID=1176721 RepID=A0ABY7TFL1_9SPHI|nr:HAMP domain-containing sensor histidine kinase [Mucilaginibacter jinjuensis]WCT14785.1 HAMP domain-containing sensor histidine kinase [Mucilaginibacter jinjuensis]